MKNILIILLVITTLNSCEFLLSRNTSDAIKNKLALEYFIKAQEGSYIGKAGFKIGIDYLNKADSIEPNNAIILHERGLVKFNFKLDIEDAFVDLNNSIKYSTDEKDILIRYNNRGLCYKEIGKMDEACEDWKKSGKEGKNYLEKYCN